MRHGHHHTYTKTEIIVGICLSFAYIGIGAVAAFTPWMIHLKDKTANLEAHIAVGALFMIYGIIRAIWGIRMVARGQVKSSGENHGKE